MDIISRCACVFLCLLLCAFIPATLRAETLFVAPIAPVEDNAAPHSSLLFVGNEELGRVVAGAWMSSPRVLTVLRDGFPGRIILWDEGVSQNGVRSISNTISLKN